MNVLISGGGIAGPTLAYGLDRHGHEPLIVETAAHLRVEVKLTDRTIGSFDLPVGADRVHSRVRELAFGTEDSFSRSLSYYPAYVQGALRLIREYDTQVSTAVRLCRCSAGKEIDHVRTSCDSAIRFPRLGAQAPGGPPSGGGLPGHGLRR